MSDAAPPAVPPDLDPEDPGDHRETLVHLHCRDPRSPPEGIVLNDSTAPYAYVSMIGGIRAGNAHRGMLLNIAMAARRLRELGSSADFVALVLMDAKAPERQLCSLDQAIFERNGVKPSYLDVKTMPFPAQLLTFAKVFAWQLTQYQAVQYLDADVMPLRNMDGLFALNSAITACAGVTEPMHGGWFVVRPDCDTFAELYKRISHRPDPWLWDSGWGAPEPRLPGSMEWTTLNGAKHTGWRFNGGDSDQGLWYHYLRFSSKSANLIREDDVVSFREGRETATSPITSVLDARSGVPCLRTKNHSFWHFTAKSKPWLSIHGSASKHAQLWYHALDRLKSDMHLVLAGDLLHEFDTLVNLSALATRPSLGFMFSPYVEQKKAEKQALARRGAVNTANRSVPQLHQDVSDHGVEKQTRGLQEKHSLAKRNAKGGRPVHGPVGTDGGAWTAMTHLSVYGFNVDHGLIELIESSCRAIEDHDVRRAWAKAKTSP